MGRFIKKFCMELYSLPGAKSTPKLHNIDANVKLIAVTKELFQANKADFASHYRVWSKNIKRGASGVFAVCNGKIIGYAWLRTKGCKDTFYRFDDKIGYVSEVFVDADFRGMGIAPAMMSYLICNHSECDTFYISIYTSNSASRNALLKVGFSYNRSLEFIRIFKITWNKYKIT